MNDELQNTAAYLQGFHEGEHIGAKAAIIEFRNLYIAINEMMAELGAKGEITTRNSLVTDVMNALHEIDDGVYDVKRVFGDNKI